MALSEYDVFDVSTSGPQEPSQVLTCVVCNQPTLMRDFESGTATCKHCWSLGQTGKRLHEVLTRQGDTGEP